MVHKRVAQQMVRNPHQRETMTQFKERLRRTAFRLDVGDVWLALQRRIRAVIRAREGPVGDKI